MRTLLALLIAVSVSAQVKAQQCWQPGACWIYEQLHLTPYLDIYSYTGDTIIDGLNTQICMRRVCYLYPPPDTMCVSDIWQMREYVSLQGDVVLCKNSFQVSQPWDTLYWLGNPGARWWPPGFESPCGGTYGMIEVQDTGHVVIDGMSLRKWDIAHLDSSGTPMWDSYFWGADTLAIIERIGGTPRYFLPFNCDPNVVVDYAYFRLRQYSDWGMNTGDGLACDIVLSEPSTRGADLQLEIHPNPGSNHLLITGLANNASIEVRDPLGRLVHSQPTLSANAPIETASWESGTYFITVFDGRGDRQVIKWLKQ